MARDERRRRENSDAPRDVRVVVKLNAEEAAEIDLRAQALGCSRQQVMVSAALSNGEVFGRVLAAKQRTAQVDAYATLRVLTGVASNLNQIAQRLHASDGVINVVTLKETLTEVQACVARLHADMDRARL